MESLRQQISHHQREISDGLDSLIAYYETAKSLSEQNCEVITGATDTEFLEKQVAVFRALADHVKRLLACASIGMQGN